MRWEESSSVEELGALCVGNLTYKRVRTTSFFDLKNYAFLLKSAAKVHAMHAGAGARQGDECENVAVLRSQTIRRNIRKSDDWRLTGDN